MKTIQLAFRSILHFRMYSFVNIIGLALSLACVITIFRYVYGELTVDHFNKKIDRICVTTREDSANPGFVSFSGIVSPNLQGTFVDLAKHSGVEKCSHVLLYENEEIDIDNRKYNATVLVADSNFMKIFDYPVVLGIENLSGKGVLITKSFAQKNFGNENPLGKTLRHSNGEILTITGVIGQTSTKSTLIFDVIVSYHFSDYWMRVPQTFVLLYPGVDYRVINKQYEKFSSNSSERYQLVPLSQVYFKKIDGYSIFRYGHYNYVIVLIAVGILILLMGIINYINVYTVVVLRRGRELGIKIIFGAGGHNIFLQLIVENLLMTGLALVAAFLITHGVYPLITNVLQLSQIPNIRFDLFLSFIILISLSVITTLYPFFRFYYSTPVNSMRNFDKIRGGDFRKFFLSFQYIITIAMIIISLFFIKQLRFMLNTDPGYRTSDIIKVKFQKSQSDFSIKSIEESGKQWDKAMQIYDEITQKMDACPFFSYWISGESPNRYSGERGGFSFKLPEGEYKDVYLSGVSETWLKLFDIQLIEGRLWNDETDVKEDYLLIVSESFLKLFGITDFNSALLQPDRRLWWSPLRPKEEMQTNPPYRIVGVIKDFNYSHLSQKSAPIAFFYSDEPSVSLLASIAPGRKQEAIDFLRNLHEETVGGEFAYSFVEDEIREMYKEDEKIATIYSIFTFIAIFISALGLFSMSLFDIQQRRKEIAIRKINGATFSDVIRLLLKKYFWTITISFVIATPVALYAIHRYLEDFANKAPVSWWLFAVALVITACISLLTLIWQTSKAANQNPAEVVKKE